MDEYIVLVRNRDSGEITRHSFRTLEMASHAAGQLRKFSLPGDRIEVVRASSESAPDWNDPPERGAWAIPVLKAAADEIDERDSRHKADPCLVFLLAWVAVFAGGVVLIVTGVYPVVWNALGQFLTQPVVADNTIGAAITITGLAVIRHLRTREK